MIQITIKDIEYIHADYVYEKCPIYCRKIKGPRDLIKKKKLNITDYIFARLDNDDITWIESDGKSCRFDKVFFKKSLVFQIPEISNKQPIKPTIINTTIFLGVNSCAKEPLPGSVAIRAVNAHAPAAMTKTPIKPINKRSPVMAFTSAPK